MFKCPMNGCQVSGLSQESLRDHLGVIHLSLCFWVCGKCTQKFCSAKNAHEHAAGCRRGKAEQKLISTNLCSLDSSRVKELSRQEEVALVNLVDNVIDQNASQAQWEFELTDSSRFFTIPSAPSKASGEVPPWLKNEATDTITKKEMKEAPADTCAPSTGEPSQWTRRQSMMPANPDNFKKIMSKFEGFGPKVTKFPPATRKTKLPPITDEEQMKEEKKPEKK